jgi:plastocyanin
MRKATLCVLATLTIALGLAACGGSEPSAEPDAPAVTTTEEPAAPGATTESAQPETAEASVAVEVKDGQPVGGPKELTVAKGDTVTIEVSVDAPQEIHVHGYELEAEATPETPAVIEFTADLEGVFDVESHTSEALLAKVVVEP